MPTCLIVGASGFLGYNLGFWLRSRCTTVGWSRSGVGRTFIERLESVDYSSPAQMEIRLREIRPDVVINAAAISSHVACQEDPVLARRINATLAADLATVAGQLGIRYVHISTDAVFDGKRGGYREGDPPNPFSVYGETKLLGEEAVTAANPHATIVRTNFFGWSPSGTRSIMEFFLHALRHGDSISGYTDFVVTSIYAQTLASHLWDVSQMDCAGLLHIASSDSVSKFDFGRLVAAAFGFAGTGIHPTVQSTAPDGIPRSLNLSLNTEQATNMLRLKMPTQGDGVSEAASDETRLSCMPHNK